jgi:hypothetical protein
MQIQLMKARAFMLKNIQQLAKEQREKNATQ